VIETVTVFEDGDTSEGRSDDREDHIVRQIRGEPEGPVEHQRLGQCIEHKNRPEDGDRFLSGTQ
jgi:hypothetical protein